jgi:hypothetical protein
LFRVLNDVECGAILDRSARIEEFGFPENFAASFVTNAVKTNEGSVANGVEKAVFDIHETKKSRKLYTFYRFARRSRLTVQKSADRGKLRFLSLTDGVRQNTPPERAQKSDFSPDFEVQNNISPLSNPTSCRF